MRPAESLLQKSRVNSQQHSTAVLVQTRKKQLTNSMKLPIWMKAIPDPADNWLTVVAVRWWAVPFVRARRALISLWQRCAYASMDAVRSCGHLDHVMLRRSRLDLRLASYMATPCPECRFKEALERLKSDAR